MSHLGHPQVGLGCVSRAAAVRPGSGQLDLNTRREGRHGDRGERTSPGSSWGEGETCGARLARLSRYLTPGYLTPSAQADRGAGRRVAGTRCRPGQSPEGHRPGNTRQLPSPRLQSLVSPCPVSQSRLISERSSAVIELNRDFFAVYQSFKKQ